MSGAGFGYDPELPDGYQEADIEMRELEEAGRIADGRRKRGECIDCGISGAHSPIEPETGLCEACARDLDRMLGL